MREDMNTSKKQIATAERFCITNRATLKLYKGPNDNLSSRIAYEPPISKFIERPGFDMKNPDGD